ncbi:hypothetical protein CTI12_AA501230 [Artemisia annua]|uniref:Uncharacterized protein n=1 Tax=Artemisia annua TaxID=35608 RepID=A0A2U1LE22_ARTAN|nr:hypothetical protein CTI12_AA501230 [Artemisia annua]
MAECTTAQGPRIFEASDVTNAGMEKGFLKEGSNGKKGSRMVTFADQVEGVSNEQHKGDVADHVMSDAVANHGNDDEGPQNP